MFYNFPFVQTRLYFTLADVIVLRDDEDPIMYETFTYPQYNHGAYGALCAAGSHQVGVGAVAGKAAAAACAINNLYEK